MFGYISSFWSEPDPPQSASSSPSTELVLDHHGALDIPEIVRPIILFVLSYETQPRLLHSSRRNEQTEKHESSALSPLSSSSSSTSPAQLLQQLLARSRPVHRHVHARDPSSVRLVNKLWYDIWLNVRLGHQVWRLGGTKFDVHAALDAIQGTLGRQRVVVQPSAGYNEDDIISNLDLCVALNSFASHLAHHRLGQLTLKEERLEKRLQRQKDHTKKLLELQARRVQLVVNMLLNVEGHEQQQSLLEQEYDRLQQQRAHQDIQEAAEETRHMTANATVVRELCLQKVPSRIKGFTLEAMFQHSIFGNLTLLDLSFTNFAEFNIEPLFDIEKSDSGPTIAVFRFLSLQHLLLRNIHLEPISSPLLDSCPAARNLVSLIVDGVIAPVSTLCNLVRLFRTPTLKRVHISRPISSQTLANDDNPGGSGLNIHEQQLTPDNSLHDILDELLQRHVHHYHPSSLQHPPLLVLPQYASLGLEFLDSSEYQDTSSLSTQPRGLRLVSGYVTGHVVHRNLLTEDRLAAYLQSEQSQSLRELHMPSVAYDVKPFIDSFSNNNNNNSDAPMHAAGSDGDHQWMTWWSQVPYRWHCRHLRRLSLSFLTSSSDRSICLQSSRELFGFLTLNCPQIEELDLQSQWMLLTWDSGLCLISRWRCLRHLVLRGCSLGYESPGVKSMIQMNNKKSWEQGSLLGSWALTAPTMLRTTTTTIIPLDVEWIVQQPTEEHVQGRRTSRAICREVLWLPPFSRPCRQDMEDGMEAESKFMPYGAGKMLDQEGCEYENGSLAKALESMLELDPAPMRSSSVALNTGSSRSTSLSNDANPQGSTSPDGTTFSEKEEEDGSQTTVDAREGALWERLQSVQFVAETLSHTDWKRPQRQWDHFVGLCRQLRPDVDFQFSYARDVPDLLRS